MLKIQIGQREFSVQLALSFSIAVFLLQFFVVSPVSASNSEEFDKGIQAMTNSDYVNALPLFDHSVDVDPTNGTYHYWRARCLAELKRDCDAVAEYKLASILSSDTKLKEDCKNELARFNIEAPKKTVNDDAPKVAIQGVGATAEIGEATRSTFTANAEELGEGDADAPVKHGEKLFKLSSKKLDWNLQVSDQFMQQMRSQTASLGKAMPAWRFNTGAGSSMLVGGAGRQNPNEFLKTALAKGPVHAAALSGDEIKTLSACDIALVLDHSGSMSARDCPSFDGMINSRVGWYAEEMRNLADALCRYMPNGFHVITFDTSPSTFQVNSSGDLQRILAGLTAGGGTNLSAALQEAFRLHSAHPNKPMLVGVVSDAMIDLPSCEKTIVSMTRANPLPNGIFITLLQIGCLAESQVSAHLNYLDNLQARAGASYDAFYGVPFSRVRQEGFGRDLMLGLRSNSYQGLRNPSNPPPVSLPLGRSAAGGTTGGAAGTSPAKSAIKKPSDMPVMWPAK